MKTILTAFMLCVLFPAHSQITKTRNVAWVLPAVSTRINGIAAGLALPSLKDVESKPVTIVNGLSP